MPPSGSSVGIGSVAGTVLQPRGALSCRTTSLSSFHWSLPLIIVSTTCGTGANSALDRYSDDFNPLFQQHMDLYSRDLGTVMNAYKEEANSLFTNPGTTASGVAGMVDRFKSTQAGKRGNHSLDGFHRRLSRLDPSIENF